MGINIRQKGQTGEREIASALNECVARVRSSVGLPALDKKDEIFQRNQNQSAVGGHDLSNSLNLAIEVKRQEILSIPSWWRQCVESAKRTDSIPILIFRQNRKSWRVIMNVSVIGFPGIPITDSSFEIKVEISLLEFLTWFMCYYYHFGCVKDARLSGTSHK